MAEIDITPPIGFRMAGYFNERLATAIHDPLKAKAIVLRQGKERFALVFCDLVGLSLNVTTNARARASQITGIPVSHIMMAATHSHTGPLFDDVRRDNLHEEAVAKYGEDPHETISYPEFIIPRLVKVIADADASLAPAELEDGVATQTGISFNRRYIMKDGTLKFNPGQLNPNIDRPAGPIDPDVGILLVKNLKSKQVIGGLTVFAMHCDTTGGTEFSADYPYFIQQTLRNAFNQNYISAFAAGTCGNINHIDVSKKEPYSGFAVPERIGTNIGETIIRYLPELKPVADPALASRSTTLTLPLQTVTPEQIAAAQKDIASFDDPKIALLDKVQTVKVLDLAQRIAARGSATWPMEVQVFRLNRDTAIVCLPAELFVEFGLAIKKASPFKTTFVMTICNDRPSYIPTLKAFTQGGYEVMNSRLKAGSGEAMVETATKMLNELKE